VLGVDSAAALLIADTLDAVSAAVYRAAGLSDEEARSVLGLLWDQRWRPRSRWRGSPRPERSVASVEPERDGQGLVRTLGGCVDLEPSVHLSSGRRSPGSGFHPR